MGTALRSLTRRSVTGRRIPGGFDVKMDYRIHRYAHSRVATKARRTDKAIARRKDRAYQRRMLLKEAEA